MSPVVKCFTRSTEEKQWSSDVETPLSDPDKAASDDVNDPRPPTPASVPSNGRVESQRISPSSSDSISLGIREPVYELCSDMSEEEGEHDSGYDVDYDPEDDMELDPATDVDED
ncbi:hypothetical protein RIF29_29643 [Crotalaria pallida]|uniref:Uncharacterized protein n=1 Tax=Crotalaria pallida TaxID=3830 RepID=A0AAN9EH27_CROPI